MSKHEQHSEKSTAEETRSAPPWTWVTLGVAFLLLLILGAVKSCGSKQEEKQEHKSQQTTSSAATSPAPPSAPARCKGEWDVRPFNIPAGGVQPFDLCWGWGAWAVNGTPVIVTNSGKKYPLSSDGSKQITIPELQRGGTAIVTTEDGKPARLQVKNRY